jgi:hypothetical protein
VVGWCSGQSSRHDDHHGPLDHRGVVFRPAFVVDRRHPSIDHAGRLPASLNTDLVPASGTSQR